MEKQMEDFKQLVISSEQEAFAVLSQALENKIGSEQLLLKFDKWPLVEIRLEGPGYESTITPDMASGLVELQGAINRAYARTVHHSTNARKLTSEERNSLQFKAKVDKGSSVYTVDLSSFAEKIALEMIGKMEPVHLVVTVIGLAIAGGSLLAYKAFLQQRTEEKQIGEEAQRAIALSREETRRLEVFSNAVRGFPQIGVAREDFDQARHEIVKGTADATSLTVNSVELNQETARIVASTPRSSSREIQLNGDYFIQETHWQNDKEVRLKLRAFDDNREFMATLQNDSLNDDQLVVLQSAEWNRTKVYMSINATELRGVITTATVLSVTIQPDPPIDRAQG